MLAQGRWFSPGTPDSSNTKTGRHDIAEILLKVALNTNIQIHTSLSKIRRRLAPDFLNYKKSALNSQTQMIKFTSCLPMVGVSLRVLRLLPPPMICKLNYSHVIISFDDIGNTVDKESMKEHLTELKRDYF